MKKLKISILRWILHGKLYEFFVRHIIWRLRFSNGYTDVVGDEFDTFRSLVKAGDIILSVDRHNFSTKMIGGEWSHAGVAMNSDHIAEMTHKNFTLTHVYDFCKQADHIAIIRCNDFDQDYILKVFLPNILKFKHASYDVKFSFNIEELYCSELPYQADTERRMKVNLADLAGLGQEYISPTGLAKMLNGTLIYSTKLKRA